MDPPAMPLSHDHVPSLLLQLEAMGVGLVGELAGYILVTQQGSTVTETLELRGVLLETCWPVLNCCPKTAL
jgi:hypothetical protein